MRSFVVLNGMSGEDFVDRGDERPLALDHAREFRSIGTGGALAAKDVDGAVLGGRHKPRGRICGDAMELPNFNRAAEGVLDDVFCQRKVVDAEEPRERDHHASGFVPEERGVELGGLSILFGWPERVHYMFICRIGRTSTAPLERKMGQPLERSTASLISLAWTTV